MRIGFVGLLLGAALLATACGKSDSSDPSDDESGYARRALEAFSAGLDSPALDPDPLEPRLLPEESPDEASRAEAPPDGDSGARRERSSLIGMGEWSGVRAFWTFLGGGGVLVMLVLLVVAFARRTTLSMDLAIRSSRRRYLGRCRRVARDHARDPASAGR